MEKADILFNHPRSEKTSFSFTYQKWEQLIYQHLAANSDGLLLNVVPGLVITFQWTALYPGRGSPNFCTYLVIYEVCHFTHKMYMIIIIYLIIWNFLHQVQICLFVIWWLKNKVIRYLPLIQNIFETIFITNRKLPLILLLWCSDISFRFTP